MPRGYGNWSDPPPPEIDDSADQPHPRRSLAQKIAESLPQPKRDTPANRRMAQRTGISEEEFNHWCAGDYDDGNIRDG